MGRGMGEIGGGHLYTAEVLLKKKKYSCGFHIAFLFGDTSLHLSVSLGFLLRAKGSLLRVSVKE